MVIRTLITLLAMLSINSVLLTVKGWAAKYGVPPSTLSTRLKNKDSLFNSCVKVGEKRKREKNLKFPEIDEALTKWFTEVRANKINIDGNLIKAKAEEFAKLLGVLDSKASNSWFEKWWQIVTTLFFQPCLGKVLVSTLNLQLIGCYLFSSFW